MARIGQLLVRADLISENNLARALGVQGFAGGRIGTLLLERGSVHEDELGKMLAQQQGCEYAPWRVLADIAPTIIASLPAKFAIKHGAIPYDRSETFLKLALRDPADLRILDELFFVTGRKILAGVAPEVRIFQALEKYYGERRIPRFAILAEKLSRTTRASRAGGGSSAPPPPPVFFPEPPRRQASMPGPQEIWGEPADSDLVMPPIIQSWKIPEQSSGGWAGNASPLPIFEPGEPESITWEEIAPSPMWISDPTAAPTDQTPSPPLPRPAPTERGAATGPEEPRVQPPFVSESAELPIGKPPAAPPPEALASEPPPIQVIATSPEQTPPPVPLAPAEISAMPTPRPEEAVSETASLPVPPTLREISAPQASPSDARVDEAPAASASPQPREKPQEAEAAAPPFGFRQKMPEALDFPQVLEANDRDSIATACLAALSQRFLRAAIFISRRDVVSGWAGTGEGVDVAQLRALEIPWSEPSIFLNIRLSRSFYLGPLPPLPRHDAVARAVGGWPDECVVQPVMIREKPVAFLYAEFSRQRGATPLDLAYLRELAAAASTAFVSAIRLRKKEI